MINIKNENQITLMKESGAILAEVKQIVFDAIKPGITTKELDDIAFDEIAKRGAKPAFKGYQGFPGTACISVNEELIHGIPGSRVIQEGDIVKVDMGAIWKGWYSDSAFTKGVGEISNKDKKLIQVARDAFYVGLDAIKPGARVGDISHAIGSFVKKQGFFVPENFTGHGIGKKLHEEPYVPNQGQPGTGPLLKDGMVICIEPMILQSSNAVKVLSDGWTVVSTHNKNTSHYEHTIVIKNGHGEIITGGM